MTSDLDGFNSVSPKPPTAPVRVVVVGTGRAGTSFDRALRSIGWTSILTRHTQLASAVDADLVLLCVPDGAIADTSAALPPAPDARVIAHVAGSQPLAVLGAHEHVGSVHPLMSLPDGDIGSARLLDRCAFAVDGNGEHARRLIDTLVRSLGGTAFTIGDDRRALYHATATIAANHLTALCGQVEALAAAVGVPTAAYWKLMNTTLENIAATSAESALTGPASRGDWDTIARHIRHLPASEVDAYLALARRAADLAGTTWPSQLEANQ